MCIICLLLLPQLSSAGGFVAETLFFASLHLVRLPYCC
jgi:hypothetical protein